VHSARKLSTVFGAWGAQAFVNVAVVWAGADGKARTVHFGGGWPAAADETRDVRVHVGAGLLIGETNRLQDKYQELCAPERKK
jgi:hypothetical protein